MSKLSFRARALDAARPLPVWLAEELPELPDYSAISRAVPQMPSGMEKEEECEHHLQRAICTGLIIPTPEVSTAVDLAFYSRCYPPDYTMPKQLIHMQPLCLEQETPEYDLDSEDEVWLRQHPHPELTEDKFEEMMDRLERSSGHTVLQLGEAKLLLGRSDDLVDLVYDYWLAKRLKLQHPLIPTVRTESRTGAASNPYLAFRRRTEKMQTRKNRKNDESSYEKMLKLRRDLSRAASLIELVVRREQAKKELVRLARHIAEKRFRAKDFAGQLLAELQAQAPVRPPTYPTAATQAAPAFRREPFAHHYLSRQPTDSTRQRDKRQNKRRKHRHHGTAAAAVGLRDAGLYSSSDEEAAARLGVREEPVSPVQDDGPFAFRRKPGVLYQQPKSSLCGYKSDGYESPSSTKENRDERHRFTLTSITGPYGSRRCVGFARRRLGRGGRVILDRVHTPLDDLWPHLDFPYSTSQHRQPLEESEQERYTHPREFAKDFSSGGKYPWRHAFRHHHRTNPTIWTENSEKMDSEKESRKFSAKRKRRRPSESSCDDSAPLEPAEEAFGQFVDEVNKEWLHFRPRSPAEAPPMSPPRAGLVTITADSPLAVQVRPVDDEPPSHLLTDYSTFTTSEFTLGDLYVDLEDNTSLDTSGDDIGDNFIGLTEAQVESILSDADLKLADEELKDDRKDTIDLLRPDDADALLEELVKTEDPFLGARQHAADLKSKRRKGDGFGCTTVTIRPPEHSPLIVEEVPKSPEPPPPKPEPPAPPPAKPQVVPKVEVKPPKIEEKPPPQPPPASIPRPTPTPSPAPAPSPKQEPKRKREEVVQQESEVAQGVQLKTVHARHSPVKKHIIRRTEPVLVTSSQADNTQHAPQIMTVAVSEGLKTRIHSGHLLTSGGQVVTLDTSSGVVGLVQNGPFGATSNVVTVSASAAAVPVTREGVPPSGVAGTSSPRRVSAPLVHLTPALHQNKIISSAGLASGAPVVVTHTQHVGANQLKVLRAHTLTQQQRTQLLAASQSRPAIVSLGSLGDNKSASPAPLQLKTTPGAVAQFYEIKGGQLSKGTHLVNVVRQQQPAAKVARLDINEAKKRQVVATLDTSALKGNIQASPRPHRVSMLDGRQLVRATIPTVRAHQVRHQFQLKNRTLVAPQQPTTSILPATSKTATIPNAVVNLLQAKNALAKSGQKIAIASTGGQIGAVPTFATLTHQQLKARQARLVAQPRQPTNAEMTEAPTTSGVASSSPASSAPADDTTTNGGVRRRGDNLPMEVT